MTDPISVWEAAASLVLIALAIVFSRWLRLGLEGSLLWASLRAAVQLAVVGVILALILDASVPSAWAWLWVTAMVVIAAETVVRRAPALPGLRRSAYAAIGGATAVTLAVVFGLGILPLVPVTLVVIAGIGIGNTMPSTVLAVDQVGNRLYDDREQVEGLLALGFDSRGAARFVVSQSARTALIPQIERTKVVGLIALPGALTGLLLAGVDPIDAVIVQLVIMYLVLGSVAVSVVVVSYTTAAQAFTGDQRLRAMQEPPSGGV